MNGLMMNILGINSAGFNTASALLQDGRLVFAVEEERMIREKLTRYFPAQGIKAALDFAGIGFADLDAVAIAWNPAINLEAFTLPQGQRARYLGEIFYSVPMHLLALKGESEASLTRQVISLKDGLDLNIYYVTHHLAHASSFFMSPFEEAAVLTVDAFGEKHSVMFCLGEGNRLEEVWSQEFPHSLGSFYSVMTDYCGFKPQGDEWKLMGASAYGDPDRFYERVRSLVGLHEDRDRLMPKRGTLSIEKARKLLGYESRYPLEKGFVEYIAWYKSAEDLYEPARIPLVVE